KGGPPGPEAVLDTPSIAGGPPMATVQRSELAHARGDHVGGYRVRSSDPLLVGEGHSETDALGAANDAGVVTCAGGVVQEADGARPESPGLPVTRRDLELSRERHHEPAARGRMPVAIPVRRDLEQVT